MIVTNLLTLESNLEDIAAQINAALWDDANDLSVYDADSLATYLERQDTLFMTCHEQNADHSTLLGIASSRLQIKPYDKELWLYVDEVDVCVDQRQKGAGKAMMKKLIEIAEQNGCEELWLGTEVDNHPANALYNSLAPDEVEQFVGYTYETDDED